MATISISGNASATEPTASKTITFTGGAGAGLNASPISLFTVAGGLVRIIAISGRVTTNLTVTNVLATITLGVTGQTALFIGTTTANTLLTTAAIWASTTPTAGGIALPAITKETVINTNIIASVTGTGNIDGGVLEIDVEYEPITPGATLVAA